MKAKTAAQWLGRGLSIAAPILALYLIYVHGAREEGLKDYHFSVSSLGIQLLLALAVFSLEALLWHELQKTAGIESRFGDSLKNTALYGFFQLFMPSVASEYTARLIPLESSNRGTAARALFALQAIKWQSKLALGGGAAIAVAWHQNLNPAVLWLGGLSLLASAGIGLLISRFKARSLPEWIPEKWLPNRHWPSFSHSNLLVISLTKGVLYALSFALLLDRLGSCQGVWIDWGAAASQYTLASLVPGWGFTEGLVLSGAGILAFDLLGCARAPVVTASLLCWSLHTALPGMIGSFYLKQSAKPLFSRKRAKQI